MEAMSDPFSPLLPFPKQHEESSYLPWPTPPTPVALHEDDVTTAYGDPCHDQQLELEFLDTLVQDDDTYLNLGHGSNGNSFGNCAERLLGEGSGNLVAIQEEPKEESSLSDLLLVGAEAVETRDSRLASTVVSRLGKLLLAVTDNAAASSFDRLAYYFARGLRSRLSGARTECHPVVAPLTNSMPANQMVQELTPFVKFAHFTATQAILDATAGDADVHVIDFDTGEGVQWPPLMSDLARRGGTSFRLTSIITDTDSDTTTHRAAGRWLSEFAESLNLPFQHTSSYIHTEKDLTELAKNCNGQVIIACSTTNQCYNSLCKLQPLLLGAIKKLHPKLVILVEDELFRIGRDTPLATNGSFVEFFCEALHHFTAVFESMASCFCGPYEVCVRLVEGEVVGPRIQDAVGQYESMTGGAHVAGILEGFRACELSGCNVAQARMLVGLFSRGFRVAQEKGRLALCWKARRLICVSVWTLA